VKIWDVVTASVEHNYVFLEVPYLVRCSFVGGRAVVGCRDRVHILDINDGNSLQGIHDPVISHCLPWERYRRSCVCNMSLDIFLVDLDASKDEVNIWKLTTGTKMNLTVHDAICLALNGDGSLVAVGTKNRIRVYFVTSASEVAVLSGHGRSTCYVVFNSTATKLASGSNDLTVIAWDLVSLTPIFTFVVEGPYPSTSLSFCSDDSMLAVCAENYFHILDGTTGEQLLKTREHVVMCQFEPESTILLL
jgi:WD40 repeat protein